MLGYQLLGQGNKEGAARIFELNTTQYPKSSNSFDSLGDAYRQSGKKDLAIKSYKKAVELDPNNLNARKMLSQLE